MEDYELFRSGHEWSRFPAMPVSTLADPSSRGGRQRLSRRICLFAPAHGHLFSLFSLQAFVSVQDFVDALFPPSEEAFAQSSAKTAPRSSIYRHHHFSTHAAPFPCNLRVERPQCRIRMAPARVLRVDRSVVYLLRLRSCAVWPDAENIYVPSSPGPGVVLASRRVPYFRVCACATAMELAARWVS